MAVVNTPQKFIVGKSGDTPEILLYGNIGEDYWSDGETPQNTDIELANAIRELEGAGRINLRLNSPGGSMFHGNAIIAAIQNSPAEIHCYVDGLAASMAADIFMACAHRHMAKNALLMVHAPSSGCWGNADDMRNAAKMLDAFAEGAINIMAACTGMDKDKVKAEYYDGKDHWMTYEQCKELGIVNETDDYQAAALPAAITKKSYKEVLQYFRDQENKGQQRPANWLTKLTAAFWASPEKHATTEAPAPDPIEETPPQPAEESVHSEIVEVMTIDAIKAAIADGTLKAADVQALLQPETPQQPNTPPAADPIADLTKQVADLTAMVAKLSAAPGAKPTFGAFPDNTDTDPASEEMAQKAFMADLYASREHVRRFQ
jgi:ATP-dependent protease ClpP protease subunit